MRPFRRLEKVTCRLLLFSILLIGSFTRPMAKKRAARAGTVVR
jgi:hypothetical protein